MNFRLIRSSLAALVVALVVAVSSAPRTALATGDVAKIGDQGYATVSNALAAAQSGDTIELVQDASASSQITVPEGKKITLDLGGHTLTMRDAFGTNVAVHGESHDVYIVNNGELTVENGSISIPNYADEGILNTGYLTLASDVRVSCGGTIHSAAPYHYVVLNDNGVLNTAAVLESTANNGIVTYGGTVNITGGSISATRKDCVAIDIFSSNYERDGVGAEVVVSGGTFRSDNLFASTNNEKSANSSLTITGGDITTRTTSIYWPTSGTLTIGNSESGSGPMIASTEGSVVEMCSGTLNVYGGTLSAGSQQGDGDRLTTDELQELLTTAWTSGYCSIGDGITVFANRADAYARSPLAVNISGGTFTSGQNYGVRIFDNSAFGGTSTNTQEVSLSIRGGSFSGALGAMDAERLQASDRALVSGGTFSSKPDERNIAPLYVARDNGDGTYTVVMHEHAAADGAAWLTDTTSHWHVCGVEGCAQVVDKADHTFEWVIDRLPTATVEGSRHQECSVCGYEGVSEAIAKLPAQVSDDAAGTTGGATAQGVTLDGAQVGALAQQANEAAQAVQEATVSGGSANLGGVTVDIEGNDEFSQLVNETTAGDEVSTVLAVTATPVDRADVTADAGRVDQAKSSNETATYLDLSVTMTVTVTDGEDGSVRSASADVTSLSKPMTVTVRAPEGTDLSGFVRVARVHDGVVDILPCAVDAEAGTVTFSTDRFSTYALLTSETAEVTFVLGNGQDPVVKEFGPGEAIVPPADPAREGYTFVGWFLTAAADGSLSDELAEGAVAEGPMTVYAGWVPAEATGQRPAAPATEDADGDAVPATGDATSVVPAVVAAVSGASVLAGAVALRRRQR